MKLLVGFEEIVVMERKPFGLSDPTRYPLFTTEFLQWLKQSIPPTQQDQIAYTAHIRGKKDERA